MVEANFRIIIISNLTMQLVFEDFESVKNLNRDQHFNINGITMYWGTFIMLTMFYQYFDFYH